jgi:hypothetical protein
MSITATGPDTLVIGETNVQKNDILAISETGNLPDGFNTVPVLSGVERQILEDGFMRKPYAGAEHAVALEVVKDNLPSFITFTENKVNNEVAQHKNAIEAILSVGAVALSIAGPLAADIILGIPMSQNVNNIFSIASAIGFFGGLAFFLRASGKAVFEQLRYNKKNINLAKTAMFLDYFERRVPYEE